MAMGNSSRVDVMMYKKDQIGSGSVYRKNKETKINLHGCVYPCAL